jgi:hypothetical protein
MLPPVTGLDGSIAAPQALPARMGERRLDERALSDARGPVPARMPRPFGHERVEHLLAELAVVCAPALEQRDGLRDHAPVAGAHPRDVVRGGLDLRHARRSRIDRSTSRAALGTCVPGPNTFETPCSRRNS